MNRRPEWRNSRQTFSEESSCRSLRMRGVLVGCPCGIDFTLCHTLSRVAKNLVLYEMRNAESGVRKTTSPRPSQ